MKAAWVLGLGVGVGVLMGCLGVAKGEDVDDVEEPAPGFSLLMEPINTRLTLSGFFQADVIHDHGRIETPTDFVTAAIVTGNDEDSTVPDRETGVSINATKFIVEGETSLWGRTIATHLSMDFFGDSLRRVPNVLWRQAYMELEGMVFGGDLLLGKAWTTFTDVDAWPATLDYEGPSSSLQTLHPIARWTRGLGGRFRTEWALEKPDNHDLEGAESLDRWPDLVVTVAKREGAGTNHVKVAGVLRDLRGEGSRGRRSSSLGWGVASTGRLSPSFLPARDVVTYGAAAGAGIGAFFDDEPPDAVFNEDTGELETLRSFGYYLGYQHYWTDRWSSTLSYGEVRVDNREVEDDNAYRRGRYFSMNLVWQPTAWWMTGVEFLRGKREDKNGKDGTDSRVQFSVRYSF
ncbi:MAG: DcaP family trimeric outer membrane transporter [Verrucomicrobiota bacterium]